MKVIFKIQAKDLAGQNISILLTKLPPRSTPYKNGIARCHFLYKLLDYPKLQFRLHEKVLEQLCVTRNVTKGP